MPPDTMTPQVKTRFQVNGQEVEALVTSEMTLMRFLRDQLGLMGAKDGCSAGHCGTCTVVINGKAQLACQVKLNDLNEAHVETIEGLARNGVLHPQQQAFIETGAVQCGFCIPGMIMSAKALIDSNPHPTREEIKNHLTLKRNLCRCTGYVKIFEAIELASDRIYGRRQAPGSLPTSDPTFGRPLTDPLAAAMVTGKTRFGDDWVEEGMLNGKIKWADHPYARIHKVDTSEAEAMEGVVAVITARDIPGKNQAGIVARDQIAIASDLVRYIGDGIAAVFAETPQIAEEAVKKILVKMVLSRQESLRVHVKRHPAWIHYKTGADATGSVLAVEMFIALDTGAYASLGFDVLENTIVFGAGPYYVPNLRMKGEAWYTKTGPTTASRQTFLSGNALVMACQALKQELFSHAAELLDVEPNQLQIQGSKIVDPNSGKSLEMRELGEKFVVSRRYPSPHTDSIHLVGEASRFGKDDFRSLVTHFCYAYSTQVAVVEADPETGEVKVRTIISANDVGKVPNRQAVEGQIEGGVVMGLGYALSEKFSVENGINLTDSLEKVGLPSADMTPEIVTVILEIPHPFGPQGVKGFAEAPLLATAPAITNAIYDALGVRITNLPADKKTVLAALKKKQELTSTIKKP